VYSQINDKGLPTYGGGQKSSQYWSKYLNMPSAHAAHFLELSEHTSQLG